jgi:putative ABC transport system permease protein
LFNQLINGHLFISLKDPVLLISLFIISLITGIIAGSYPAFLLASLKPAIVLKGNTNAALTGASLRKALVIFQFTLSIILIFGALIMRQQTNYLLKKDLGYDKNNIINVWLQPEFSVPFQSFKTQVLAHSSVTSAGYCGASPMEVNGYSEVSWPGKSSTTPIFLNGVSADQDVLATLKFEFVKGRNFSRDFLDDSTSFIITQKAAEVLGMKDPIGQVISYTMYKKQEGKIIGVVKDFHNEDIHAPIDPVIFTFGTEQDLNNFFIRYENGKAEEALAHVKAVFNKFHPGIALQYSFLDSDFEAQFYQEKLFGNLSLCFTVIAIVIAGLGLLGLTMFNTQRRTKEIGVRKVLGASVQQVVIMLCRDFFVPVMISFAFAFPLAYYLMEKFLEGYAFRIAISALSFMLVAAFMVAFVFTITAYLSLHAARKNPVDALKE